MIEGHHAGLAYKLLTPSSAPAAPLLVLTGLMGDSRRLRRLARDLGAARPLCFVDPIGGGDSDAPADPAEYAWAAQVDRLVALLDHLGLRDVEALGLSLGGMWAQQLHLRAPGRLRRLVCAASCGRAEPRLRAMIANLRAQLDAGVPPLDLARCLMVLLFSPPFLERAGAVPLIEGMLSEQPAPRPGLLGQLGAIVAHDAVGRLAGLPARVIGGELDWLMPPGEQARLARELGAAAPLLLPGAGHCLWIEQPEAFARAVLESLGDGAR